MPLQPLITLPPPPTQPLLPVKNLQKLKNRLKKIMRIMDIRLRKRVVMQLVGMVKVRKNRMGRCR